MTGRNLYIGTLCVIAGFAIIFLLNVAGFFVGLPSKYLTVSEVKSIAVEHAGKLYTLNPAQQIALIEIFNHSISLTASEKEKMHNELPVDVTKIVITRYSDTDVIVKPVGYVGTNSKNLNERMVTMVYSAPDWSKSLLEESFPNEMIQVLTAAYEK